MHRRKLYVIGQRKLQQNVVPDKNCARSVRCRKKVLSCEGGGKDPSAPPSFQDLISAAVGRGFFSEEGLHWNGRELEREVLRNKTKKGYTAPECVVR